MAKEYRELDSQNQEMIEKIVSVKDLDQFIKFSYASDDNLGKPLEVKKVSPINKFISNGIELVFVMNENLFDRLIELHQLMVINEVIHSIVYDNESDTISLLTPDISTYSGYLEAVGAEPYIKLIESIKSIKDQLSNAGEDPKTKKLGKDEQKIEFDDKE